MTPSLGQPEMVSLQPLQAICDALLERGRECVAKSAAGLCRLEVEFNPPGESALIAADSKLPFFYFRHRDENQSYFGLDRAAWFAGPAWEAAGRARALLLQSAPGIRAYGGGRFDPHAARKSEHWAPFSDGLIFVPRLEVSQSGDRSVAALHFRAEEDAYDLLAQWREQLTESAMRCAGNLLHGPLLHQPAREAWNQVIQESLAAIAEGPLQKVVAARESTLTLRGDGTAGLVLERLWRGNPSCFHFAFRPRQGAPLFAGASPELLFERDGRSLRTEAVAGTCPRGDNQAADLRLARAMQENDKEQREHDAVAASIRDALAPLLDEVGPRQDVTVLKLAHLQHLRTKFSGTLHPAVADAELLQKLHPTPATNGSPTAEAMAWLRTHESWDRGWYAGPLGVMSADQSTFTVAIRSALLDAETVRIFAGAGLVNGSDADSEWAEIEAKSGEFIRHLTP